MSDIDYLNESDVLAVRATKEIPPNRNVMGYGSKIPTQWELQIKWGRQTPRWHRVYTICYSNAGSAYVLVHGKPKYLGFEPRDHANQLGVIAKKLAKRRW